MSFIADKFSALSKNFEELVQPASVGKCYEFSKKNLEDLVQPATAIIKDDEATVGTETSEEDPILQNKMATEIQAVTRGMIARKNTEKMAMMETRERIGQIIMDEEADSIDRLGENMRSVRELLKANKSTWKRCQKRLIEGTNGSTRSFVRIGFVTVHSATENNKIVFTTRAERSEKAFDMHQLEILPGKLGGIFAVQHDEFGFVDYEAFLEKALLLHERVLGPFLHQLKEHLENVNGLLEEIDAWLTEPKTDLNFLRNTFGLGETLEIAQETTTLKKFDLQDDFQLKGSFNIQSGREKRMLERLLAFISTSE